jgi:hypothetical protein
VPTATHQDAYFENTTDEAAVERLNDEVAEIYWTWIRRRYKENSRGGDDRQG